MKRTLMIGVAAGALLAGINLAAAQSPMERPAASGGGVKVEQKVEQKGSAGVEMKAQEKPAISGQAQRDIKADTKAQSGDTKGQASSDTKAQGNMKADSKGQAASDTKAQDSKSSAQGQADTKASAQGGSGAAANLSVEQKTRIRETVIKSGPRVSNVNFSISVGTVVPRTVRYEPLPTILVDLNPSWRGYYYFIVEDRIVIIEPSSFKIITIINV